MISAGHFRLIPLGISAAPFAGWMHPEVWEFPHPQVHMLELPTRQPMVDLAHVEPWPDRDHIPILVLLEPCEAQHVAGSAELSALDLMISFKRRKN